jgi:hypothetical protein
LDVGPKVAGDAGDVGIDGDMRFTVDCGRWVRRRYTKQKTRAAIKARPTTPPTTAPAIAPALIGRELEPVAGEEDVAKPPGVNVGDLVVLVELEVELGMLVDSAPPPAVGIRNYNERVQE